MVELVGAHHFGVVPVFEHFCHHALDVVEVLLRLQGVVNAVVTLLIKLSVWNIWVVAEMGAAGGFDQSVRHERARRNDSVDDTALNQFGDD